MVPVIVTAVFMTIYIIIGLIYMENNENEKALKSMVTAILFEIIFVLLV